MLFRFNYVMAYIYITEILLKVALNAINHTKQTPKISQHLIMHCNEIIRENNLKIIEIHYSKCKTKF
jgi:hypothetical protein